MSAAAARRRKQLAARKKQQQADAAGADSNNGVLNQLEELLKSSSSEDDESIAYEALQLAQSQVRKRYHNNDYKGASDLAYNTSLQLLKKGHVSVASQLLMLLVQVLRETHTEDTDEWVKKIEELHAAHEASMTEHFVNSATANSSTTMMERKRLEKLQRDWLRRCVHWSSEMGPIRFGRMRFQELLGNHCWKLSELLLSSPSTAEEEAAAEQQQQQHEQQFVPDDEDNPVNAPMDLRCDAVVHMALAEKPQVIVEWLKTLPDPTKEQITSGHTCPPCERDALFTRALLCFVALENIRDANVLVRSYKDTVEKRDIQALKTSYVSKDDGQAPSHIMFGCMLLRTVEKDTRTGPLFSWLLRSFKRELDMLHKPKIVHSYTNKIGKTFFNIEPPPSMMKMMENMMNMMGGGAGGMGGAGGPAGGLNPAMMQALASQMQGGGMF